LVPYVNLFKYNHPLRHLKIQVNLKGTFWVSKDSYSWRPQIPKWSRFTISELNYCIYISPISIIYTW